MDTIMSTSNNSHSCNDSDLKRYDKKNDHVTDSFKNNKNDKELCKNKNLLCNKKDRNKNKMITEGIKDDSNIEKKRKRGNHQKYEEVGNDINQKKRKDKESLLYVNNNNNDQINDIILNDVHHIKKYELRRQKKITYILPSLNKKLRRDSCRLIFDPFGYNNTWKIKTT
ncbi:hypothetical protein PFTANZ_02287 [Plasmodium falciparum Tanzania (2000708)]|nr:hypothetical protein PFTANZ_02287 [Plasmodium falciparum Tanzania (2000708)]